MNHDQIKNEEFYFQLQFCFSPSESPNVNFTSPFASFKIFFFCHGTTTSCTKIAQTSAADTEIVKASQVLMLSIPSTKNKQDEH